MQFHRLSSWSVTDALCCVFFLYSDENFLNSLDNDVDGEVSEFEYLSAMLILLEYCEQDDVDRIMKSFRKLDRDGSKSLDISDLKQNLKSNRKKNKKVGLEVKLELRLEEKKEEKDGAIPPPPDGTPPTSVQNHDINRGKSIAGGSVRF